MIRKTTRIVNRLGLHARPSAMLVTVATRFEAEVFFTKNGLRVNGKSIMGVMMLAAEQGSELTVEVEGPDEEKAAEELVKVIQSGFGEEL
ncbi:MAG TPA: HPr family phosphocarrier protein [candidate division Zixibacteria bacterium]|nr:HPr family phosphocarrier protein [candidate division Zixibacteria bacterium]